MKIGTQKKLVIVVPVYNDWLSFRKLLAELSLELQARSFCLEIVAVDDCSTDLVPDKLTNSEPIEKVEVLTLSSNVGHQRAIAIGLASLLNRDDIDFVAIMDSDGEDKPCELINLLDKSLELPDSVVVAQRVKRSEGWVFRFFYRLYTRIFKLLTGQEINFGNFSVFPFDYVYRVTRDPNIWNNFAACVIKSRLPLTRLATTRGERYDGQSKMNFSNLVVHGLGAISVFSDIVYVRILLASIIFLLASLLGVSVVVLIRLFTDLAIPGWTTNVSGFLLLVSLQAVMMPILLAFVLLSNRTSPQVLPEDLLPRLIRRKRLFGRNSDSNAAN